MSAGLAPEDRARQLLRFENPTIDEAVVRQRDIEHFETHGHFDGDTPAWCERWAALLGTTPALVVSTVAHRHQALAFAEAFRRADAVYEKAVTDNSSTVPRASLAEALYGFTTLRASR